MYVHTISAAWQSRTDSRSFIPGFFSFPDKSFLCVAESSLRLGPCLLAAEGQRVEVVSIPSWLPSMAGGGILHGPHTLWLTALMAVCILMEACWTETWMTCSCFLLFKPEDNVWSALLSLLTVDQKWTSLQFHYMKIQSNWSIRFRCRLEVKLDKHFSELEMIYLIC